MTSLLDTSPRCVMDVLRGARERRPALNTSAAAGLRAELEDAIYLHLGPAPRVTPITLRAASLRASAHAGPSPLPALRGVLVARALRLLSVGVTLDQPFDDAVAAWRAEGGDEPLLDVLAHLEADDVARLATDVTAHCVTLSRSLGPLPTHWSPRTSLRAYQRLAGGNVILRDAIDLMVGTTSGDQASVALLDVTTAALGEDAERVLRYHALVQTLRTSVVPLRSAMFSTATGELWAVDVDDQLLRRAVGDVVEALSRASAS